MSTFSNRSAGRSAAGPPWKFWAGYSRSTETSSPMAKLMGSECKSKWQSLNFGKSMCLSILQQTLYFALFLLRVTSCLHPRSAFRIQIHPKAIPSPAQIFPLPLPSPYYELFRLRVTFLVFPSSHRQSTSNPIGAWADSIFGISELFRLRVTSICRTFRDRIGQ